MRRVLIIPLACVLCFVQVSPATAATDCTRSDVRSVVRRFISAYNGGDFDLLNRLVAKDPQFRWFRVMPLERDYPFSDDRDSLIPYFKERHGMNDQLRLISLKVGRERARSGGYYFSPRYVRRSDDARPWADGEYAGKAEVTSNCKIFVWTVHRQF